MVNTRQRMTNAGHTRREFRQLQQQHRETDSTGGGRFETTRQHRAGQVVDEHGVPYIITDGSSRGNSGPELPSAYIAFKALLTARLLAAFWSSISDCDETFNYWEPMHYLIYGKGFQTWEYAPTYGLRSYAYILLHTVPGWFYAHGLQPNRMYVWYCIRCILAVICAGCETYFYIGVTKEIGANVGRITLGFLIFSAGMFVASTAFLPATTSMYLCMIAIGAWFQQSYAIAIFATAASTYLSWPFAAILGLPIAWDILFRKRKFAFFIQWSVISTITLLLPQVLIDSQYYGKLTIAPFNIVKYNVLTDHGPDLYGTEPFTYYLFNGILNFNVVFILGLLVWPLQGFIHLVVPLPNKGSQFLPMGLSQLALYCWLSVFWSQAHKEERFLFPIYPLIVVAGAISVDTIQKLWYHFFVKVQKKHYLEHTTWISLLLIGLSILLSIMRMVALYKNYHASMDIWMHVNHLSHTDEFHKGRQVNVCVGKEWYRFPSNFFLSNDAWNLQFIQSEFKGQLPQPYSPEHLATSLDRPHFNDLNLEEPTRYVKISECDFLVDYENGQSTSLEPIYSQDTNHWKIEMSLDFLDAPRSHKLFRAFYVPGTRGENGFCTFGQYVLLRNVKRQSK